ncbi:MAG TPA: glutathione S-transferase family protein [Thermoanaerobaculia bacterium]|nr:glutathione S-transferase family protein [Thermoanaerobaculia bacterium]
MKLYNSNLSPFAACVRLAIYAKKLEGQVQVVPPPEGGLKSAAYLAINPIGKVPALQLDGWTLPESTVICDYLEDRFPEPSLRPHGADDRARMRLLMRLVDLYLYPGLLALFAQANSGERSEERITEGFRLVEHASTHLEHWFGDTSHAVGNRLTLADCSLMPALFYVRSMSRLFHRDPFGAHPKLGEYYKRLAEEPVVARVIGEMKAALAERRSQQAR